MEGVREKEFSNFHSAPGSQRRARFITLDKIGLRMLAANAKSRRNTKDETAVIGDKFRDLEAFFDLEGLAQRHLFGTELHVVFGSM